MVIDLKLSLGAKAFDFTVANRKCCATEGKEASAWALLAIVLELFGRGSWLLRVSSGAWCFKVEVEPDGGPGNEKN